MSGLSCSRRHAAAATITATTADDSLRRLRGEMFTPLTDTPRLRPYADAIYTAGRHIRRIAAPLTSPVYDYAATPRHLATPFSLLMPMPP